MKKLLLPLFVLITLSVQAAPVTVNTPKRWNSAVIEAALADAGIRRDTDSEFFYRVMEDLLQRDSFSVLEAVSVCKQKCYGLHEENVCSSECEIFGKTLVKQNNQYSDFANSGYNDEQECERLGNDFIWVGYYKACAPRDVCRENSWLFDKLKNMVGYRNINFKAWCIEDFQYTQVRHVKYAEKLAASYLENMIGKDAGVNCHVDIPEAGDKKSFSGDNYIPCVTGDGRYFVFKFDDTTESFAGTPRFAFQALCSSLRGRAFDDICKGLTKAQCETIGTQLDPVFVGDDDTKYNEVTGDCKWD